MNVIAISQGLVSQNSVFNPIESGVEVVYIDSENAIVVIGPDYCISNIMP